MISYKLNIRQIIQYLTILFLILLSKTVFFGIIHEYETTAILFLLCMLMLINGREILLENKNIMFILYFVLLSIGIVHASELFSKGTGLFLLKRYVYILMACIIASNVSKREFKDKYVNIICVISIISLISKLVQLIFPLFIESISTYAYYPRRYIYTFFCTFGRAFGLETRNYGPFWEPGAFQIFLIIALWCAVFCTVKNREKKILLLVFTIVTTGSTAGYIGFLIIFVFCFDKFNMFFNKRNAWISLLIFVIVVYVVSTGNISNKLTASAANSSLRDRLIDFEYGVQLIKNKPIFGYGNANVAEATNDNIYYSNSNGLLAVNFIFGIPFAVIYFFLSIVNFKNLLEINRMRNLIGLILAVIVLHLTEETHVLAISYCFLFRFKSDDYYDAAEPPVRSSGSQSSGGIEPL